MNDDTPLSTESMIGLESKPFRTAVAETPRTLATKLEAVGYQEPELGGWSECAVDGCHVQTLNVVCLDCEMEIEALTRTANFNFARDAYLATTGSKAGKAFWYAMGWAIVLVPATAGLAVLAAWAWNKVAWAIGQVWP